MNQEQFDILEHTYNKKPGYKKYCGSSKDMDGLVELGYMLSLQTPDWWIDTFYQITPEGEAAYEKEKLARA